MWAGTAPKTDTLSSATHDQNMLLDICSCPRLNIGMCRSDSRNWNPDCLAHGSNSEWFRSPEQRDRREAQDDRIKALQAEARRLRHGGEPKPRCRNCGTQHFSWTDSLCEDYSPIGPDV